MARSRGPVLRLVVAGTAEAASDLEGMSERAKNAKPVMQTLLADALQVERDQFETSGIRSGTRWADDKPITVKRKQARGQDTRPERMTGALEKTLTAKRATGAIRRANKQSFTIGTRLPYAKYQGKNRPLLGIIEKDTDRFAGIVIEYLLGEAQ